MNVGEAIKHIRTQKNITQKELGEKLGGIPQQQIGRWENGKVAPKLETIKKIAEALNIDISELIGNERFSFLSDFSDIEKYIDFDNNDRHHLLVYHYDELGRVGRNSLMEILAHLKTLNSIGQKEAVKRVEELTEIPRYTQKENAKSDKKG